MPILQVILFGYAIRTDVDHVRLAIVDPVPDSMTVALRARFDAAHVFETVAVLPNAVDLEPLFRRGAGEGAGLFEPGFAERLGHRGTASGVIVAAAPRTKHARHIPGGRGGGGAGLRAGSGGARTRGPHRADAAHAVQPDPGELEPVRPRSDGVRADDRVVADDRHFAHPREGNRHARSAARLAAATLA